MNKLLVTGGAGFIGSNFVHYWLANYPGDEIVVLDALTYAGNQANLAAVEENGQYRFVHGDIRDQNLVEKLLRDHELETIVNFAAESHVDRSIHAPDIFVETNIVGTHALLKAARTVWLDGPGDFGAKHRFHHVSTDEIYGSLGPDAPPFTEKTPYAPNSPYSASKAAADHLVRAYHHTYGLSVSTSSCSNNYGPYQFPEKLIPLIIINILHGQPLPIYGDGMNVRDWLYVEDHCRGIDLVIKKGRVGKMYNIGGNNEWTNIDIVRLVCETVDEIIANDQGLQKKFPATPVLHGRPSQSLLVFVKDRPGHDRRYAINATKCEVELGFRPAESFATGIRKTIAWYLNNQRWWEAVIDGSYRDWISKNYVNRLN
jgi:dTDP-glucose 4,6-dehydratase